MLNFKSLRELVYQYLRDEISLGNLRPGSPIKLVKICEHLKISRTPVRDALLQLESEGFVKILPRRAFTVKGLTLQDVKNMYEIIGSLEATTVFSTFEYINDSQISKMEQINTELIEAINQEDFDYYHNSNHLFHDIFLDFSDNLELRRQVRLYSKRLHDFTKRIYTKKWELDACHEHQLFIGLIKKGARDAAASFIKDVHWSFKVQEKYILKYYSLLEE